MREEFPSTDTLKLNAIKRFVELVDQRMLFCQLNKSELLKLNLKRIIILMLQNYMKSL